VIVGLKRKNNLKTRLEKIKNIVPLILYLTINSLFIYKYGARQSFVNVYVLLFLYPLFIISILYFFRKTFFKESFFRSLFWISALLFAIVTIAINYKVDGHLLNVDRWSAIDVSVNAVLNGQYPFSIPNHLNQYSSNLPSLIFVGLPFYLLGDVGYLQSFAFLFYIFVIYKVFATYKIRFLGLFLLVCSTSYLWEIYVKSDLMSNFIFVLGFIVLWHKYYSKELFKKPVLLGVIVSFIAFTRIPTIIPLILFLFKGFIKTSYKNRLYFLISSISVILISTFIVLKNCPSIDVLRNYNPLILQGNKSPFLVNLISILLPLYFSFKVKNINECCKF